MATDLVPKSSHIFECKICDYITDRKSQYSRHILTAKHKLATNINKKCQDNNIFYDCECGKKYKDRTGLWRHKKKYCQQNEFIHHDTNSIFKQEEIKIDEEFKITPKMFYDLLKQNNELQKNLIELASKPTIGNNNNVNSNNKTFNLQVFLNETCKDALNINDFINQITLTISDLEETGKLGYAEGISKVFIKNLKDIDLTRRPIHCSDSKREILYIKNEDQWSKEDDQKTTIKNAIKHVANKNIKKITEWQKKNPNYADPDSKQNDKYMQIVLNSMSGSSKEESEKNYEKIVKNISKEVVIQKDLL
jgi:hypothetical protein